MLVLRPYSVLQVIQLEGLSGNQAKANALLQRLVAKKDEHQYVGEGEVAEQPDDKIKQRFPIAILLLLSHHVLSFLFSKQHYRYSTTVFQVSPENSCYKRLCRFLI